MATSLRTSLEWINSRMGTVGAKSLPLKVKIRFTTTWDVWIYRSLCDLVKYIPEPAGTGWCIWQATLHDIWKLMAVSWQSSWLGKGNIVPIFRIPRKWDHGSCLLVSLICVWEDQGTDPSGSCAKTQVGQGGDLIQPAQLHQGQLLPDQFSGLLWRTNFITGQRKGYSSHLSGVL